MTSVHTVHVHFGYFFMCQLLLKRELRSKKISHRVGWKKGMTFQEIAEAYVTYVQRKYGNTYVVFDGYEDGCISVKSNEHARRSLNKGAS